MKAKISLICITSLYVVLLSTFFASAAQQNVRLFLTIKETITSTLKNNTLFVESNTGNTFIITKGKNTNKKQQEAAVVENGTPVEPGALYTIYPKP